MQKLGKRLILDAALSVMLIAEMFIQVTGVFGHEIIGMLLFVGVVAHLILERVWIANTFKGMFQGRMSKARAAKTVVAGLLVAAMVAMGVSSVIISTVLYSFGLNLTALNVGGIWTVIHTASAYVICGLVVVHLVMHWAMLGAALRIPYNPSRRAAIGTAANAVAAVGVIALGVAGAQAAGKNLQAFAQIDQLASNVAQTAEQPPAEPADRGGKKGKRGFEEGSAGASVGEQPSQAPSSSGSSSSSSATGICTLCHKACPLSAPKCNKPYSAGLI